MNDTNVLEEKIRSLEKRMEKLEETVFSLSTDTAFMDQLYKKARELVIRHNKATVIFLQKKLIIDFERASRLMQKLEKDGVVSPPIGEGRKILIQQET